jgi:arylsulfatase A-like enzyme
MVDQMQARVLEPDNACQTPNLNRLITEGVRFRRAVTASPVCTPARASLMTGLLPHNHGAVVVTHNADPDQFQLRADREHWAQRLVVAGYRTAYFGKWHVEHSEQPSRFGWQVDCSRDSAAFRQRTEALGVVQSTDDASEMRPVRWHVGPPGYRDMLHYGVTVRPPEERDMGVVTSLATDWLRQEAFGSTAPWCGFLSFIEPHDPFVAGAEAFARYDIDALELPPNAHDDLEGRPGLYRKSARQWRALSDREKREAMACYYASITELDEQLGRVLDLVRDAGQLDGTVVVFTSDHGELLGAHGLYAKNIMAAEECYGVPMVFAGPGVRSGVVSESRVSLMDVGPTLLELVGLDPLPDADGESFAAELRNDAVPARPRAFAESFGGRYLLTQRVVWDGDWKLVFNGFDEDELYDLRADPHEMTNLIDVPDQQQRAKSMMALLWARIRDTGDRSLLNTHYAPLRLARYGPDICDC